MKSSSSFQFIALILITWAFSPCLHAGSSQTDFSNPRTPGKEAYQFTTQYLTYAPDGSRVNQESTILEVDIEVDDKGQQHLTCRSFSLKDSGGNTLTIPQLSGYTNDMDSGSDQVMGVNHADFVDLKTDDESPLPPELSYRVYNTFIDFYAFNNIFAQPVAGGDGKSIADLREIGQKIVHYSAFSEAPVDLGESIQKGSYFKNGEVTLEWIGSSVVNEKPCELVEFDSGESSFEMRMEPAPEVKIRVKGGSQYWGDLYINTESFWVEKARFKELVISQVEMNGNPGSSSLIKRIGVIEKLD